MIFYQTTVESVTLDMLIQDLFKGCGEPTILDFTFLDFPTCKTIPEALAIIDAKRTAHPNPYNHSFLNIELKFPPGIILNDLITLTHNAGNAFQSYFHNNFFVFCVAYKDKYEIVRTSICISDIERFSLETASLHFPYETLFEIFNSVFSEYHMPEFSQDALYLYNSKAEPLPYDGVICIECPFVKK